MSMDCNLNERYQKILRATIQHYIATAEPVGSKTLMKEYNFSISSATIRNALGKLEKVGLLYQPHTSAGRVPSDSGYRIYVDQLLIPNDTLKTRIEQDLSSHLNQESWTFEGLLKRATQILANLSGYIALITFPQPSSHCLRHLQLMQISAQQVMLILVTDGYQTQSVVIDLPQPMVENEEDIQEELQLLSNFLNHKLKGRYLTEIMTLDWQEVDQEFMCYADFLKQLLTQLHYYLSTANSSRQMFIYGVSEALRLPEFSQLKQVHQLLHLLEQEQKQLVPLISNLPKVESAQKRVNLKIGSENPLEAMHPCTLVSAAYCQKDVPAGSVGIIGPTRMLYEQAIPLVESTADYLSDALS